MSESVWNKNNCAFKGARFNIHNVDLPGRDNKTYRRETVVPADAVVIIPLLYPHTVLFIRNQRFAVGENLLELPAGTIEPGEDHKTAAAREVAEETGYQACHLEFLCDFYTTPGFCTEKMYVYLATDLKHVGQNLDETEKISVHALTVEHALEKIKNNQISDGKTIAALLFALEFSDKITRQLDAATEKNLQYALGFPRKTT